MDIFERLKALGGVAKAQGTKFNQYSTEPVVLSFTQRDVAAFNEVYRLLISSDLNIIKRTPSGAIAQCRQNRYAWDVFGNKCGVRITAIVDGCCFVWRVGREKYNASGMKGWKAWRIFERMCAEESIDLQKMAIRNGAEVKRTIQKPYIRFLLCHIEMDNCHHIDFHSSYFAGLCNTHPEFKPIGEKLYKYRHKYDYYKDIMNCTIGYMQSVPKCGAKWAHLSRDAILDNNTRIDTLTMLLLSAKRRVIGFNTDGIWYQGKPFHDPRNGEGNGLGQWHNDHLNCKLRAKSDGAYEFMEGNQYHAVIRGQTQLDLVKERKDWQWGDIYQDEAKIIKFRFESGKGLILKEGGDYEEDEEEDD